MTEGSILNGADVILKCLRAELVDTIFGYPGAAIAPLYDAIARSGSIRHVLVRHEQNAGHAASGYARASGAVGVCCATSGPGAVNLISALATAYMDSIPVIALTGQVPTELLGRDVFQEADITGACEPFTKYCYLVKSVNDLPVIIREAFYIASTGRPGPVLVDLPTDVLMAEYEKEFVYPVSVDLPGYKPRTQGHPLQIKRAVEAINAAERPVLCAGGGVVSAGGRKELVALAQRQDIPVVSTLMGVGVMPTDHRLYYGMLGSHGSPAAAIAVSQADLLILCGARVGDRTLAAPGQTAAHAKIVHIDIDTVEIGKNMSADIPIVGDVRLVLHELADNCPEKKRDAWVELLRTARPVYDTESSADSAAVEPNRFMRTLSRVVADRQTKAILVADVGQNQIWAANSFAFTGGRFLTSGGMGTMGYSIPAAMGAKLAKPLRQVIAVCGDGSFQMMIPELATLKYEGVTVKIIVMRNGCLGMIRELQDKHYDGRRIAYDLGDNPDIGMLAKAYGVRSLTVSSDSESESAINWLLDSNETCILECIVNREAASTAEQTGGRA